MWKNRRKWISYLKSNSLLTLTTTQKRFENALENVEITEKYGPDHTDVMKIKKIIIVKTSSHSVNLNINQVTHVSSDSKKKLQSGINLTIKEPKNNRMHI